MRTQRGQNDHIKANEEVKKTEEHKEIKEVKTIKEPNIIEPIDAHISEIKPTKKETN